jgi:hypothetical protein
MEPLSGASTFGVISHPKILQRQATLAHAKPLSSNSKYACAMQREKKKLLNFNGKFGRQKRSGVRNFKNFYPWIEVFKII